MAKRSSRDFCATMEQQLKQFKPVRVNPFPLMMDAARHYQAQQAARQASGSAAAGNPGSTSTTPATTLGGQHLSTHVTCSHCGTVLPELQVQQCHACKAVYCSSCSVINYDEREDRVFCLDCNIDSMQLTSCNREDLQACGAFSNTYAQPFCSPPDHGIADSFSLHCSSGSLSCQAAALSAERRSSVRRACQMAAAAAAAAADSGGSCMAAMAGISGLAAEQLSPLFVPSGLHGFGGSGVHGGGGGDGSQGVAVLGQWDLNSPHFVGMRGGQQQPFTPAGMLPFTT